MLATSFYLLSEPDLSAISTQGMVTSPHPMASEAGRDVLARGGNAIEAAIAMAAQSRAVLAMRSLNACGMDGE